MAESGERARFDFTTGEDPAALVLGVMSGEQDASGRPAPRSSDGRPLMVNNAEHQEGDEGWAGGGRVA